MKGTHKLSIQSKHLQFEMEFSRNLTIIQGDSATGKTTLVDMIQEHLQNGTDTGIFLSCDVPCRVIAGATWQEQLRDIENSIVFIDEGNRFVSSKDFAHAVNGSGNYYVVVTREALYELPYSVTEIYGIRSSGKFNSLEPVYHHLYRIYGDDIIGGEEAGRDDRYLVVEDSNSGFEFFAGLTKDSDTECISAGGASSIFSAVGRLREEEDITVIADGAAIGPYMGRLYQLMDKRGGIRLYLPESFEWIILAADLLDDAEIRKILEDPSEYIDSKEFVSWERYFTKLLTDKSDGTWMKYSKSSLNPVFLQGRARGKIVDILPECIHNLLKL